MNKAIAVMLLVLFSASLLSACNTTKGFAKDLQKVGEEMEGAAEETGGTDPD